MSISTSHGFEHDAHHAGSVQASPFRPAADDTIRVGSRRWFLQTGAAGVGGLSLAELLAARCVEEGSTTRTVSL